MKQSWAPAMEAYRTRKMLAAYWGMRILVASAGLFFLVTGDWVNTLLTIWITALMSAPAFLRRYKVFMPFSLDFGIVAFVFLSSFLGQVQQLYDRFPPWDTFVHFQSGILFAVAGFVLVFIINERGSDKFRISPGFVAIFAAAFAIATGALWEIGEYLTDTVGLSHLWQAGLDDTMLDLAADSIGAAIVGIVGYLWMKRREHIPFTPASLEEEEEVVG